MSVISQSELVRKALAYVIERRANTPGKSIANLLDEAGMRFNLTPLDTAALERIFYEQQSNTSSD
ncbi:MAG: hypothetical protein LBO64_09405 [Desulfovibrio sp.]|jgi:hypothetical protein|nr:hypothetical protein [Desulfovibrio sp.]